MKFVIVEKERKINFHLPFPVDETTPKEVFGAVKASHEEARSKAQTDGTIFMVFLLLN